MHEASTRRADQNAFQDLDAGLISLFLDMLAAEQGAGDNTLDAYRRDLTIFPNSLRAAAELCRRRNPGVCGTISPISTPAASNHRAWREGCRRCGTCLAFCSRTYSQRRSGRDPVRAEARPRPAEGAVDLRRRSPAGARQSAGRCAGSICAAAASRAAAVLPAGGAVRHRPAGFGAGGAAALGRAARRPHDRGARQGQQGTSGAAERGVQAGDGRFSRRDGSAEAGRRKTQQARNGCFPPSARADI